MEKYMVFYYNNKELCAYTLRGSFFGETEATAELLAYEHNINIQDIIIKIEER